MLAGQRIIENYMPAHDLIDGDLIVYENTIFEVRVKRKARFYPRSNPALLPILELLRRDKIDENPALELIPSCIDTMFRMYKPHEPKE
jgi:hypothetical protein